MNTKTHQFFEPTVDVADLMQRAVPWAFPDASRFRSRLSRLITSTLRKPTAPVDRTVIEASVSMPADWEPYSARDESDLDPRLEEALEDALEAINTLQTLAYTVTGRPTTPVAPQNLPFSILFAVGILDQDQSRVLPHPKGSFGHFTNYLGVEAFELRHLAPTEIPTVDDLVTVPLGPFDKVAQLGMEADSLLRLSGQSRASLIMTAAACEALLDTTLMMLMWESSVTPEEAAAEFNTRIGIKARVGRSYPPRLGGAWTPGQVQEISDWLAQVVEPRNQVIHFGASITRQDAEYAFTSYVELKRFLCDRLWRRVKVAPFTALTYSTSLRVLPEDAERKVGKFDENAYELPPAVNFGRWVDCLSRLIDQEIAARSPSPSAGGLLAVVSRTAQVYWVWHDWTASMCRLVNEPPQSVRQELADRMQSHQGSYGMAEWLAFTFAEQSPPPRGPWVEEHNIVPGLEVLPDSSDLGRWLVDE